MAESQTSSDPGTGQDTGTVVAATGEPTGTEAVTSSDQVTSVPSESQPSEAELDEITRTVSAGGEKAVEMLKHWQRVASSKDSDLSKYKPLEELVNRLGGAENVRDFLLQYDFIMSHPDAKKDIMSFLTTQEWKTAAKPDDLDSGYGDETDPTQEELKALRQEVQSQRMDSSQQKMRMYMGSFFDSEMAEGVKLGEVLTPDQKSRIMSGLDNQIKGLGSNESGQQTLRNLNIDMVKRMMQLQIPMEEWAQIGEKSHLLKIERKKGAATGAAPASGTTGNEERAYSGSLSDQLAEFAREEGIDLYKLGGR
jgi:hypothetical protein